ncbi:MAG TPA: SDR family oxidoreductase, partial [Opitutus sp.]|nr:SDR family oxidoreductase [Opitutus sp.]
ARAIQSLATTGDFQHPLLSSVGWWRRRTRLEYPPISAPHTGWGTAVDEHQEVSPGAPPLLVVGPGTPLGRALLRVCHVRGLPVVPVSRRDFNLTDPDLVFSMLAELKPWAVVNTATFPRIDDAEDDPAGCFRDNTSIPIRLAEACAESGVPLALFSTDLVFDGRSDRPYVETDATNPLNVFGRSKREMEERVGWLHPGALIVRAGATFGPWDSDNFVSMTLRQLEDTTVQAADDTVFSPTYIPDLINTTLDLLIDGETGLWHLANQGALTWAELARQLAQQSGLPTDRVVPVPMEALGFRATRPRFSALASARGTLLPSLERALERYFVQRGAAWRVQPASRG